MLPSASHSEAQAVFEKQNLIKVVSDSVDKAEVVEVIEVGSGDESESDNEEIIQPEVIKKSDVNFDDEFEKIVPLKFERLSEESSDEVDNEIAEILHEAQPLGQELQTEPEIVKPEIKTVEVITEEVQNQPIVLKSEEIIVHEVHSQPIIEIESELKSEEIAQSEIKPQEIVEEKILREESTEEKEKPPPQPDTEQKVSDNIDSKPIEEEIKKTSINDVKPSETIIDEKFVPIETPLSAVTDNTDDKPPVPIQTYLWEDVRRAKEQVSGDNVCTPSVPYLQSHEVFCSTSA